MFTDPVKNLKSLGLHEDSIVADLGAGTGFYSVAAGHLVPKGKVYAIEVVKDFLITIKNKVQDENLKNVEIIWGNIEKVGGTKIGDGVVDVAIASNVLSQVEDKEKFIAEAKRILKPKGRVLLVDWTAGQPPFSPKGALSAHEASGIFEKNGFVKVRDINTETHHYGMILAKS